MRFDTTCRLERSSDYILKMLWERSGVKKRATLISDLIGLQVIGGGGRAAMVDIVVRSIFQVIIIIIIVRIYYKYFNKHTHWR